ncbi:uncharacterized protein EDB91DRAFT_1256913 [Suillus paluster]|uniref:uncharacterized protein n=1 Tax=Suillus paluster TaxID=48578 RepID=UPI001B85CB2A|nr:uncharacterized protein EDB91DRAFT_1256913 [Suillus paluster]KAG1720574.1 hypothetical protein EDB91DRAFT_1256913 [Suillus paluster]
MPSTINDQALATPTVAIPVSSSPLNAAIPASPSQAEKVRVISKHTIPQTPVIHPLTGKSVQCTRSTETPRAIGALSKYIPSKDGGLMQHLNSPNISESHHSIAAHLSALQPNKDCDDSDASTTGDESTDSTELREARAILVLDASRAQRDVCLAEKRLADSIIKENDALGRLYRFQAGEAQKQLVNANIGIGYIRHSIRKSGIALLEESKPRKRRRTSESQTNDLDVERSPSQPLVANPATMPDPLMLEPEPTCNYDSEASVKG